MKKIMITLAFVLAFQAANAQEVKSPSEVKSSIAAAEKAAADAKKAEKVATWLKLGKVNLDAYVSSQGNGSLGQSEQEIQILMSGEKNVTASEEVVMGTPMKKVSYSTADYYYQDGRLAIIRITNPIVKDALDNAAAAYLKAYSVDVKGQKTKDILAAQEMLDRFYTDEAYNAYKFNDMAGASAYFEKAFKIAGEQPLAKIDSASLYNAAFTAWSIKDYDKAEEYFTKAIGIGYPGESGDAYVKLSDIADKRGDKSGSKAWLEEGFQRFPQSQSILVSLINYYLTSNESPEQLFVLIDKAKANEPNNASLYYVEGNIHKNLGEIDAAFASYDKCSEINPEYEYGFIGKGILYYDQALKYQDLASSEMDDTKWNEYMKQFEGSLKACIEPFEKAFEVCKDEKVRKNICEYLKNACFRFRTEDESYLQKYEKYSAIVAE